MSKDVNQKSTRTILTRIENIIPKQDKNSKDYLILEVDR